MTENEKKVLINNAVEVLKEALSSDTNEKFPKYELQNDIDNYRKIFNINISQEDKASLLSAAYKRLLNSLSTVPKQTTYNELAVDELIKSVEKIELLPITD